MTRDSNATDTQSDIPTTIHGTVVEIAGRGVLLRGPAGIGKSDLALRLIALGACLVADDRVCLSVSTSGIEAFSPHSLAGLLEIRAIGILHLHHVDRIRLALVVDLVLSAEVERLPLPDTAILSADHDSLELPAIRLAAFEASTPYKIIAALTGEWLNLDETPSIGMRESPGLKKDLMNETIFPVPAALTAPTGKFRLLLVTGMSGAGRATSLKMLEDLGYEAVDNLPLSLLPRLISYDPAASRPLAVGVDIRTRDFAVGELLREIDELRMEQGLPVTLVFLDCDDDTLARRFTETRRRHPLAMDRPVRDGILLERERLAPLRSRADILIDTTKLQIGDLKRVLYGHFSLADQAPLTVFVTSFSFREGLPREADLVFDVRFLKNPYYWPDLKHLTGQDPAVAAFIEEDPDFAAFWQSLTGLLAPLLPRYDHEGKSYLTIAIGCTGGRHRSVFLAEKLARWIADQGQKVTVAHRDMLRSTKNEDSTMARLVEALSVSASKNSVTTESSR